MSEGHQHRRFYKANNEYKIGEYIPDVIRVMPDKQEERMDWLKYNHYGSVLFFFSRYCKACDIEVAFDTLGRHPLFNAAIFCEGYEDEFLRELQSRQAQIKIYSYDAKNISDELGVNVVPFMLVVNKVGQVIAAGVVNTYEHAEELLAPMLRVAKRDL